MSLTRAVILCVAIALFAAACGSDGAVAETTTTAPVEASSTTTLPVATTVTTTTLGTTTTTEQRPPATVTTIVVQLDLTALGYFNGTVDGIAGAETRAAIAKFQSDNGIEADGEFGPVTDSEMVPQLMADTAYVEDVQEKLQEPDLYTGPIDGDYGAGTTAAIKKLQADCDLEQTGEIDIATRICLYEA